MNRRGMSHTRRVARREFLREVSGFGLSLAAGSLILGAPGCSRRSRPEGSASVLERVRRAHRELGGLPDSPIAVAQASGSSEYPFIGDPRGYDRERNECYPLVEEALMLLNPESPENPLSNIVRPGDRVVIKPNWCTQNIFPVPITHPSVVHPVAELAAKAGAASVTIVEGPMTMTHAATWFYGPIYLNVKPWIAHLSETYPGTRFAHRDANADDFLWISLGSASLLRDHPADVLCHDRGKCTMDMFYDAEDATGQNPRTYTSGLYAIARSYLDCDVFINMPKMKTHGWTGVTLALKNLMGLNVISTVHRMPRERVEEYTRKPDYSDRRECGLRDVPHYDGRYRTTAKAFDYNRRNDVLWRSLSDLNRIILYCDKDGQLQNERQRRYLNVVDGIVGTDGDGPISLSRVASQTIVAGADPVRVDAVCCRVMGYDPEAIPLVAHAGEIGPEHGIGSLKGYAESIVTSRGPASALRTNVYEPPASWLPNGEHSIFAKDV